MTFLKILLIFVGIYYLSKWLLKAWFGNLLQNYYKQVLDFEKQQQQNEQASDHNTHNTQKANKKVGEYIDYEEVS